MLPVCVECARKWAKEPIRAGAHGGGGRSDVALEGLHWFDREGDEPSPVAMIPCPTGRHWVLFSMPGCCGCAPAAPSPADAPPCDDCQQPNADVGVGFQPCARHAPSEETPLERHERFAGHEAGDPSAPAAATKRAAQAEAERLREQADAANRIVAADWQAIKSLRSKAQAVVDEYRTDLRGGRWSDVLLEAVDELRRALASSPGAATTPADGAERK
jgi:hypothetical protein